MRTIIPTLLAVIWLPGAVFAGSFPLLGQGRTSCESLWVERNQIINLAGFCFSSELGQRVFYNGDCSTRSVSLGGNAQQRVDRIAAMEARQSCQVDTSHGAIVVYGRSGPIHFGAGGAILGMWPSALNDLDVFVQPNNLMRITECSVAGLDPAGDGFLSIRSGPDVRYNRIGILRNFDTAILMDDCRGSWCFAAETRRGGADLGAAGWLHTNWCADTSG